MSFDTRYFPSGLPPLSSSSSGSVLASSSSSSSSSSTDTAIRADSFSSSSSSFSSSGSFSFPPLLPRQTSLSTGGISTLPSPSLPFAYHSDRVDSSLFLVDDFFDSSRVKDPPLDINDSEITPNVKVYNMSGHDVPLNVLETLGLGLEFIPSSDTFSVSGVMDTLNSICARLFKESAKEPYSGFSPPPFSRSPLFKWNQLNKNDKKCVSDVDVESLKELDSEGIISKFHSLCVDDIYSTFNFSAYRFLNLDLNTNPSDVKSFTDYFTFNKQILQRWQVEYACTAQRCRP